MAKKGKTTAHRARKAESRKRGIQIETPLSLIDAILDVSDDRLAGVEAAFYTDIYAGGYPHRLYAPGLKSLTDLPPALLDGKGLLPPVDLIPDSPRALDIFLRRLTHRRHRRRSEVGYRRLAGAGEHDVTMAPPRRASLGMA